MKIKSLKSKILLYFILFTTIPLIISSFVILFQMYQSKKESIFQKHYQVLNSVQNESNNIILEIEKVGQYLKNIYPSRQHLLLQELPHVQKNISTILILDNQGILQDFSSTIKTDTFIGYDYSNTPYFVAIKNGQENYWSEVYLSTATNLPVISYSVRIDVNSIAVLIIDLRDLNNFAKKFKSNDGLSMVRITDRNGLFLAHPDNPEFISQQKNILDSDLYKKHIIKNHQFKQIEFKEKNNIDKIGIFGISNKLGWIIIVKELYSYSFSTFNLLMWFIILFLFILVTISIYFSIKLSKSILKPLDMVSKHMDNIANNKQAGHIENTQYFELDNLVSSFSIMQNKIADREQKLKIFNEQLEQKVDEKTKLLLNANEKLQKSQNTLQTLNENLESKVKEEVKKNSEKEKLLAQQTKMASMGEMLENIAHQWRQPLSVISTASSGIKIKKELGISTEENEIRSLDQITNTAKHLSHTIDDFRDFFKSKKNKEQFNLSNSYYKTLNILESKFKNKNIELIENLENIELYNLEGELVQVIMNLLNNACDVLQDKKQVRLIFIDIYKKKNNAILKIKDNGGGIDPTIIDKIFDPYFTTKHQAQGTGIGLYMSQEIITKHMKGTISVENENLSYNGIEYKGASFQIILPI